MSYSEIPTRTGECKQTETPTSRHVTRREMLTSLAGLGLASCTPTLPSPLVANQWSGENSNGEQYGNALEKFGDAGGELWVSLKSLGETGGNAVMRTLALMRLTGSTKQERPIAAPLGNATENLLGGLGQTVNGVVLVGWGLANTSYLAVRDTTGWVFRQVVRDNGQQRADASVLYRVGNRIELADGTPVVESIAMGDADPAEMAAFREKFDAHVGALGVDPARPLAGRELAAQLVHFGNVLVPRRLYEKGTVQLHTPKEPRTNRFLTFPANPNVLLSERGLVIRGHRIDRRRGEFQKGAYTVAANLRLETLDIDIDGSIICLTQSGDRVIATRDGELIRLPAYSDELENYANENLPFVYGIASNRQLIRRS